MLFASNTALWKGDRSVKCALPAGYAARPHTGLASLLRDMESHESCRYLVLTRDVLDVRWHRSDLNVSVLCRTRKEAIEMLKSCKPGGKPFMVLCRPADEDCTERGIHQLRRLADRYCKGKLVLAILLPPWKLHVENCYEAGLRASYDLNASPKALRGKLHGWLAGLSLGQRPGIAA